MSSDGVIKKILPNELTVLLKEDHANPVVAINVWFRVGSVNETERENGLAHFQEHMVFKGTERHGVGEIANLVKSAGGNLNAGTSYSYTMYYVVMPSKAFSLGLDVQADAMMNSTFDPEEFQKERRVVIDEARMYDDTPDSFTYYRTMELGFEVHNYRRPIAGYENIVREITRDQLLDFYKRYYRPSNAILTVVGDIDPDFALEEIERVYGGWKDGAGEVHDSPPEPDQVEFRFNALRGAIDHAYFSFGFHVPSCLDGDYAALEMLCSLLGSGRSSRLYRRVVEGRRLATTVHASLLAEKWPGFFMMFASSPVPKWNEARDAVCEELARFQTEAVPEAELLKARRQLEKTMYSELETVEGQASNLGYYELLSDYRLAEAHREAIRAVTAEDITRVARMYFRAENCSVVSYLPEGGAVAESTREDAEACVRKHLKPQSPAASRPVAIEPRVTLAAKRASAKPEEAGMQLTRLDNGVRVLVKRRTTVPMVTMLSIVDGGTRFEPPGQSGLSSLATRMLIRGTHSFDADAIATTIESLGGRIESFSSFDVSGVYVNILSEYLEQALPVYREVLREPRFAADVVEKERGRLLEELAKRSDHPFSHAMDNLFVHAFGEHPYAHPFLGERSQLASLTAADCRAWHERNVVADGTVLVFVGDIAQDQAVDIAARLFSDLPHRGSDDVHRTVPEAPATPGVHELRRPGLRQAVGLAGFLAPQMMTEEAIALTVLNGILTGLGGRLFVELRDKRSLGYMAGSAFMPLRARSLFFGYSNPNPDRLDEALGVIQDELQRVTREDVHGYELTRAKEWLVGSHTMKLQRNLAQAIEYGTYEALGFGFDTVERAPERVKSVTAEAIRKAASAVFSPEKAVMIKLEPSGS